MILINNYCDESLDFNCTECMEDVQLVFNEPFDMDGVYPIKVECPVCGEYRIMLLLKCSDECFAKGLMEKFIVLKEFLRQNG